MTLQLGMIVLDVRDLDRSIKFYRALGVPIGERFVDRPVAVHKMTSGVSLLLVEGFAVTNDPMWVRPPTHHYQQMLEFVVDDDAAVDARWRELTDVSYYGRKAPGRINGVYLALVDDPDGNVVMISSDPAARPD